MGGKGHSFVDCLKGSIGSRAVEKSGSRKWRAGILEVRYYHIFHIQKNPVSENKP